MKDQVSGINMLFFCFCSTFSRPIQHILDWDRKPKSPEVRTQTSICRLLSCCCHTITWFRRFLDHFEEKMSKKMGKIHWFSLFHGEKWCQKFKIEGEMQKRIGDRLEWERRKKEWRKVTGQKEKEHCEMKEGNRKGEKTCVGVRRVPRHWSYEFRSRRRTSGGLERETNGRGKP